MNAIAGVRHDEPARTTTEEIVHDRLVRGRTEMFAFFRRRLSSREDAEDALQDMSLKAIRAATSLESEERADAWLGRVMHNTLVDHYRRKAARRLGEEAFGRELLARGAEGAVEDGGVSCHCVRAALGKLRPDQADLIRRIDLAEETRERVAADLGITANALGVRLHRARQALKLRIACLCPTCAKGQFANCNCGLPGASRTGLTVRPGSRL